MPAEISATKFFPVHAVTVGEGVSIQKYIAEYGASVNGTEKVDAVWYASGATGIAYACGSARIAGRSDQ